MPPIRSILDAEDSQNLFDILNKEILKFSINSRFDKLEGKIDDKELSWNLGHAEYLKSIYQKLYGQPYGT